jgi:Ca2+-binding EF-hand superfamily protein
VLADYGSTGGSSDSDGSGTVDDADIEFVEANYGSSFAQRVLGDATGNAKVDTDDLLMALADFRSSRTRSDVDGDGKINRRDLSMIQARMGATASTVLTGDVNGDRLVDDMDIDLIEAHLGSSWAQADLNGDGTVNVGDLMLVLSASGDSSAQRLIGDISGDGLVDAVDQDLLTASFGSEYTQADVDANGSINTSDLMELLSAWGETYGSELVGDIDGSCSVDETDIALYVATLGSSWAQADLDGDGIVATSDNLILLENFGAVCE